VATTAERRAEPALRGPIDRLTARLPKPWRTIVDWALTIGIAVVAVFLIKAYVVNPYRIPSSSMEPTLHCARPGPGCEAGRNDRVIANRFILHFRDPKRADVIVFNPPPEANVEAKCGAGGTYVKRLIGLPGDSISQENGIVFVDGTRLDEPYLQPDRRGGRDFEQLTLGADEYFMMGDNRRMSCDSRVWGPISRDDMIGPVFFVYWPLDRIGFR
jgi:signal peptidase I